MSEIFLSYKSEDLPRAKIIAEALEQQGYSVWWDMTIPPGKTFDEVIEKALDSAKCVVVLWSRKSVLSDWVKEEASVAVKRRILLPVLIDDVKIPIGFKRIQAARLIDWQGTLPNPELILQVLKHAIYEGMFMIRRCAIGNIRVLKYVLSEGGVNKWLKLYTILWIPWAALCSLLCLAILFMDGESPFFFNLFMDAIVFLLFVIIPFLPIYFLSKHR
jgi:hypothetical protein